MEPRQLPSGHRRDRQPLHRRQPHPAVPGVDGRGRHGRVLSTGREGKWGCGATAIVYLLLIPALHAFWELPLISLASLAAAANVLLIIGILLSRRPLLTNVLTIAAVGVQLVFQQFTFVPILTL